MWAIVKSIKSVPWLVGLLGISLLSGLTTVHAASPYTSNSKLIGYNGAQFDLFGISVDIAPSGAIALVGASQGTSSVDPGKAYYFTAVTSSETGQKLTAGDPSPGGDFGHAVALSDDVITAVIGSPDADVVNDSPNVSAFHGAVYVYTRSGSSWAQRQKLTSNAPVNEGFFGCSVDVSDDGSTVVVGSCSSSGEAYVFVRSIGPTWSLQSKLTPAPFQGDAHFGVSVAISGDGNTVLVGSDMRTENGNNDQGAAFVFVRSGGGWLQQSKLTAADGAQWDYFGNAVDLSNDGNTAIVGANWKGASYVFIRSGATWDQQKKLTASDSTGSDRFGQSVALSNNGNIAVVGAKFSKSAYLFTRGGATWEQQQKLVPNSSDANGFGGAVAVSDDGQTVLVGADETDVGSTTSQGVVYIFRPYVPMPGPNLLLLKPTP